MRFRAKKVEAPRADMILDGMNLDLKSIYLDGRPLPKEGYEVTKSALRIFGAYIPTGSEPFLLGTVVQIKPQENTRLEGLYRTSGNFCTHCEAEGFRYITYFPDRPDVLTRYTTKVTADKETCPVLLSNGNLVAEGDLENGRHFALFMDPYPKPSYLFALVAGVLVAREGTFTTMSGKNVDLKVWCQPHNLGRTAHALRSLQQAMKWDEKKYGLEYDLGIFNIVAVDDFNMVKPP